MHRAQNLPELTHVLGVHAFAVQSSKSCLSPLCLKLSIILPRSLCLAL
jgi:hypothetical protein